MLGGTMSHDEIEGKKWVEAKLRDVGKEYEVSVTGFLWRPVHDGPLNGGLSLEFQVNEKPQREEFTLAEIEDCPNDRSVQKCMEKRFERVIGSGGLPEKKIGFKL